MKPLRYVERYWSARQVERAKFWGAAMARYLNRGEPYRPHPRYALRLRLMKINLRKRS